MEEGCAGKGLTITTISTLSLSTPLTVWLTKYEVDPSVVVDGVGATVFAEPANGTVYQLKVDPLEPEAVN
jgi:hypothetical protein